MASCSKNVQFKTEKMIREKSGDPSVEVRVNS
jgi:hypothetical protein